MPDLSKTCKNLFLPVPGAALFPVPVLGPEGSNFFQRAGTAWRHFCFLLAQPEPQSKGPRGRKQEAQRPQQQQ